MHRFLLIQSRQGLWQGWHWLSSSTYVCPGQLGKQVELERKGKPELPWQAVQLLEYIEHVRQGAWHV